MKITLNKSQWEEIGRTAGWTKTAQSQSPVKFKQGEQLVKQFFEGLRANHGGRISESANTNPPWLHTSLEFMDEAIGTMWIQIRLDLKWDFVSGTIEALTNVAVERYYDSEAMAARYNKTVRAEVSLLNMDAALATTESMIQKMKLSE